MIKVILVDDHQIVLDGLKSLLDEEEDIEVLAMANNGKEALTSLDNHEVDIAILDVEMPEMNGIEASEIILNQYRGVKILVLTMYSEVNYIHNLLEIGVHGYILKNKGKEELVEAIRDIHKGKTYYSRQVTNQFIKGIQKKAKVRTTEHPPLTKTEKTVLRYLALSLTVPEIAEKVHRAKSTIETHKRNIIDKLGLKSTELVRWAIKNGYDEEPSQN